MRKMMEKWKGERKMRSAVMAVAVSLLVLLSVFTISGRMLVANATDEGANVLQYTQLELASQYIEALSKAERTLPADAFEAGTEYPWSEEEAAVVAALQGTVYSEHIAPYLAGARMLQMVEFKQGVYAFAAMDMDAMQLRVAGVNLTEEEQQFTVLIEQRHDMPATVQTFELAALEEEEDAASGSLPQSVAASSQSTGSEAPPQSGSAANDTQQPDGAQSQSEAPAGSDEADGTGTPPADEPTDAPASSGPPASEDVTPEPAEEPLAEPQNDAPANVAMLGGGFNLFDGLFSSEPEASRAPASTPAESEAQTGAGEETGASRHNIDATGTDETQPGDEEEPVLETGDTAEYAEIAGGIRATAGPGGMVFFNIEVGALYGGPLDNTGPRTRSLGPLESVELVQQYDTSGEENTNPHGELTLYSRGQNGLSGDSDYAKYSRTGEVYYTFNSTTHIYINPPLSGSKSVEGFIFRLENTAPVAFKSIDGTAMANAAAGKTPSVSFSLGGALLINNPAGIGIDARTVTVEGGNVTVQGSTLAVRTVNALAVNAQSGVAKLTVVGGTQGGSQSQTLSLTNGGQLDAYMADGVTAPTLVSTTTVLNLNSGSTLTAKARGTTEATLKSGMNIVVGTNCRVEVDGAGAQGSCTFSNGTTQAANGGTLTITNATGSAPAVEGRQAATSVRATGAGSKISITADADNPCAVAIQAVGAVDAMNQGGIRVEGALTGIQASNLLATGLATATDATNTRVEVLAKTTGATLTGDATASAGGILTLHGEEGTGLVADNVAVTSAGATQSMLKATGAEYGVNATGTLTASGDSYVYGRGRVNGIKVGTASLSAGKGVVAETDASIAATGSDALAQPAFTAGGGAGSVPVAEGLLHEIYNVADMTIVTPAPYQLQTELVGLGRNIGTAANLLQYQWTTPNDAPTTAADGRDYLNYAAADNRKLLSAATQDGVTGLVNFGDGQGITFVANSTTAAGGAVSAAGGTYRFTVRAADIYDYRTTNVQFDLYEMLMSSSYRLSSIPGHLSFRLEYTPQRAGDASEQATISSANGIDLTNGIVRLNRLRMGSYTLVPVNQYGDPFGDLPSISFTLAVSNAGTNQANWHEYITITDDSVKVLQDNAVLLPARDTSSTPALPPAQTGYDAPAYRKSVVKLYYSRQAFTGEDGMLFQLLDGLTGEHVPGKFTVNTTRGGQGVTGFPQRTLQGQASYPYWPSSGKFDVYAGLEYTFTQTEVGLNGYVMALGSYTVIPHADETGYWLEVKTANGGYYCTPIETEPTDTPQFVVRALNDAQEVEASLNLVDAADFDKDILTLLQNGTFKLEEVDQFGFAHDVSDEAITKNPDGTHKFVVKLHHNRKHFLLTQTGTDDGYLRREGVYKFRLDTTYNAAGQVTSYTIVYLDYTPGLGEDVSEGNGWVAPVSPPPSGAPGDYAHSIYITNVFGFTAGNLEVIVEATGLWQHHGSANFVVEVTSAANPNLVFYQTATLTGSGNVADYKTTTARSSVTFEGLPAGDYNIKVYSALRTGPTQTGQVTISEDETQKTFSFQNLQDAFLSDTGVAENEFIIDFS